MQPNFIAAYLIDPEAKPEPLVLLMKRSPQVYLGGVWQMVTGKVNVHHGESILKALRREIREETGFNIEKAYSVNITLFYDELLDQVGFNANFLAFVNHTQTVTLSPEEHSEFCWCTIQDAISRVAFSDQKETLEHLWKYYIKAKPHNAALLKLY